MEFSTHLINGQSNVYWICVWWVEKSWWNFYSIKYAKDDWFREGNILENDKTILI